MVVLVVVFVVGVGVGSCGVMVGYFKLLEWCVIVGFW